MKYLSILLLFSLFLSCNSTANENNTDQLSPLEKLKAGNENFTSGHLIHPNQTPVRINELKGGQHPFAVIVSCSDSRLSPELIFDQGLGDLFSIRTAGNVIGDLELGSIEYAVEHLHCKLVVVLGHENCGAIQAYAASTEKKHNDHIQNIIDYIADEEEEKNVPDSLKSNIDFLVMANIAHGVNVLKESEPVLKSLVDKNELTIVGAYYDLDNGHVI